MRVEVPGGDERAADYVKWLPQLLAVESKNDLPGTDCMVQLGVWIAALRKRLEGLMRRGKTKSPDNQALYLKPMPCLKIEGLD